MNAPYGYRLVTGEDVAAGDLRDFLAQAWDKRPAKADFLASYSAWLYRGEGGRFLLIDENAGGRIVGQAGVMPTQIWLGGEVVPALWWVDLILLPAYRGHGLHNVYDGLIRGLPTPLKLGFATEFAIKLHAKRGWGTDTAALWNEALPLRPYALKRPYFKASLSGLLLRAKAGLAHIRARRWVRRLPAAPPTVRRLPFEAEAFAELFQRTLGAAQDVVCTYRDAAWLRWRYAQSPVSAEYQFWGRFQGENLTHLAVLRALKEGEWRLLDLWGNLPDSIGWQELLAGVIHAADLAGATQVITLSSWPPLRQLLRQTFGFKPYLRRPFCWYSAVGWQEKLAQQQAFWTLADSDNDTL